MLHASVFEPSELSLKKRRERKEILVHGDDERGIAAADDLRPPLHVPPLITRRRRAVKARFGPPREHDGKPRLFEALFQKIGELEVDVALLDARPAPHDAAVHAAVPRVEHNGQAVRLRRRARKGEKTGGKRERDGGQKSRQPKRRLMPMEKPHGIFVCGSLPD